MMLKSIAAVGVVLALVPNVARAETSPAEQALGELMAVMVMATRCDAKLNDGLVAQIDAEGPRIQKAAGIREEDMEAIAKQIGSSFTDEDCPNIKTQVEGIAIKALASAKRVP